MLTPKQELALLKKAQTDRRYFAPLFDLYYPRILRYCYRRTTDIEVAQDITAEVFVKALKDLSRFRWQGYRYGTWLYRVANNLIVDYFRKGTWKTTALSLLQEQTGREALDPQDLEQELLDAEKAQERHVLFLAVQVKISQLPIASQEVIHLYYFENLDLQSIAAIVKKPLGTVKSLLSRARVQLRKELENNDLSKKSLPLQPLSSAFVIENEEI